MKDIRDALEGARGRPPLNLRTVPASASAKASASTKASAHTNASSSQPVAGAA